MYYSITFCVLIVIKYSNALVCHQCNGWHGDYPLKFSTQNTCDNRNNQCQTEQFCVKIIDTMSPGVNYATYESDCSYATTIQINPTNLSTIVAGTCYPYQDGSSPVKRYAYCYCNNRDYCNSSQKQSVILFTSLLILFFYF